MPYSKASKSTNEPQGVFIVNPPKTKPTPDSITRGIFGISVEQLIKEIQTNKDGKYDCLYVTAE